tara:strand:- start:732 stop:1370 length:639 start_codon:yes stop_codon:yes gene_type:complete
MGILSQEDLVDDKYREDQIYVSFHYNSLKNTPEDLSQNKFSSSLSLGFIRDLPINKNRNFGFGLGLGFSRGSYNNNFRILKSNNNFQIEAISDLSNFSKNKWTLNQLEIPFEIRWRTSTATNYKFWRIYTGIKTSYLMGSKSKYNSDLGNETLNNLPFNKLQQGLTINLGNNTWNIGLFLGLTPIFNDEFAEKHKNIKNIKPFKVGLVFYIL